MGVGGVAGLKRFQGIKERKLRVGGVRWVLEETEEADAADSRMPCGGP